MNDFSSPEIHKINAQHALHNLHGFFGVRQQLHETGAEKHARGEAVAEVKQTTGVSRTKHLAVRRHQFQRQQDEQQRQSEYDEHNAQLQQLQQLHV